MSENGGFINERNYVERVKGDAGGAGTGQTDRGRRSRKKSVRGAVEPVLGGERVESGN